MITYEEYHPYGSTAFRASRSGAEVSAKRYRYTGMEKDEETGLGYHGARYYVGWLGRWCSADPLGITDGYNLYSYTKNKTINAIDNSGFYEEPIHGALTYYLALAAGFIEKDAAALALSTAGVDHNPVTDPLNSENILSGRTEYYHFASHSEALLRVEDEINKGMDLDIIKLGEALHTLEDVGFVDAVGPHKYFGIQPGTIGHPIRINEDGTISHQFSHTADQAFRNPKANQRELMKIYELLEKAADKKYGKDVSSNKAVALSLIKQALKADSPYLIELFLNYKNKNFPSNNSYSYWVENNEFTDVTWTKDEIDYSVNPGIEYFNFITGPSAMGFRLLHQVISGTIDFVTKTDE